MDSLNYYRIEKVIGYMKDNFTKQPDLDELAARLNLSSYHFQRIFKKWAGVTPKRFIEYLTTEYIKNKLKDSETLLNATIDSGLSSLSRSNDLFINIEAVTPKEFRQLGKGLNIYYYFFNTQFGLSLIAVTDRGICKLSFITKDKEDAINDLKYDWPEADLIMNKEKTQIYFNKIFIKNQKEINSSNNQINIFLKGTNFQIQVWKALLTIPEGNFNTYQGISDKVGSPKAFRAVGTAIGQNPIAYLIPCHRVINKNGMIGNYAGGKERKRLLIGYEASLLDKSDLKR